ncbi:PA14 domain-containing protein [Saprospiraceae bacterium]|nr:PA14 domain-containing protein [Saprospiraceae bacterium]
MYKLLQLILSGILLFFFSSGDIMANSNLPNSPEKESKIQNAPPPSMCIGNAGTIPRYIYENINNSNNIDRMRHEPNFPQSPDHIEYLNSLQSSYNWNNNYGSFMRGFILAPETGQYVFNLTGDDSCEFYMSPDDDPANIVAGDTTAHIPGWSNITEHNKYPSQTSDTINLIMGQYYYFEVYQKEGGGGDHVQVYWKLPSTINQPDWEIVHGVHLYEYICDPVCPSKGTACDDGNANTINDQEDGACNCWGVPETLPFTCIGERGNVKTLYWDNISGDNIVDLQASGSYPLAPDRAEIHKRLQGPNTTSSIYGSRIRGFLYIPITGDYTFNVTGNNETSFMLSTAETPDPNTDEIARVYNDVDEFEHYGESSQTSTTMALTGGTFYSIELLHKEHYGGDHFAVFWKTPFARDTAWHIIDGSFIFQYSCELACIPQGTACDDGDSNTFNDLYDANCNCVGTPCSNPECTNALGYTPYDECASSDKHSNSPNDAWLSCQPTQSPNPARGLSHWVHYDFGSLFNLDQAQIWNYNGTGGTTQGFNNVVIDYSLDGTTWTELGTFNWGQASGQSDYQGFTMSEFSGIIAQHILITALGNFDGSNCMGISEISFSAFDCPSAGTACDDGNIETNNDVYDVLCNCQGLPLTNSCTNQDTILNNDPIASESFEIQATITSAGKIYSGGSVQFIAGTKINLMPGFKIEKGGAFISRIVPCNVPLTQDEPEIQIQQTIEQLEVHDLTKPSLSLSPNPTRTWTSLNFNIPESGNIQLSIYTSSGQLVTTIVNTHQEAGQYNKDFPAHQLAGGVYYVTLKTDGTVLTERLIIVD